jgi:uncharacterized membrane protein
MSTLDMKEKLSKFHPVGLAIGISALILFGCGCLRHALFQSTAWDLGIFDQAVYLISQGQTPFSSLMGFHVLGDHAAFILYPLALLYKIYPDVRWLLAVQATALVLGALPTWHLARLAGLKAAQATAMAFVYLLYPLIFNINLFDFHPDVIAIPAILAAVLAARLERIGWFCLSLILILSCKAVLALTVAAMGLWLLIFEKKRLYGAIALGSGIAWFLISTQIIIPFFGHEAATIGRHVARYENLGKSFPEIAKNLLLQPGLLLSSLFSLFNLEYLCLLLLPIIWGLSPQHLMPLVGAIPTLAMNLLTNYQPQKDLIHQYSLPALPFLLLAVISTLASGQGWLQNRRGIVLWALVAFIALAKYGFFGEKYLDSLDTWQATQEAIAQIHTKGGVLVPAQVAPHLTQRSLVKLTMTGSESIDLSQFQYVLLNVRHPGWGSTPQTAASFLARLRNTPKFQLHYQRDDVYLFVKRSN